MSATLCIQDKYLCYQCKSACDIHGRSCRNGLMFPVLLLMGGISKCPNYEFDIEKVKESANGKEETK